MSQNTSTPSDAVKAFVNAANELRKYDDVDVCYTFLELAKMMPIKLHYALFVPAKTYTEHVKARLPEE